MTLTKLADRRQIFAEDHAAFRDSVTRFASAEITPHLEHWRLDGTMPRSVFTAAGAAGFLGTAVPEEFGGGGVDDLGFIAVLIEEIVASGAVALAWAFAIHAGLAPTLLSETGCSSWLSGLASGELIVTVGNGVLTETDGRLSGGLPGVHGARYADLLLVDLGGADVAVVEINQRGVDVDATDPGLGGREAGTADVRLDGAEVSARIPRGAARDLDLWFAVTATAAARTAFGLGLEYVNVRKVFGRPLAAFENTRFRLAELAADFAAATALADSCVAAGASLTAAHAAAARLTATHLLDEVTDQCLQFHGGYGYMREYPISTAFADSRFLRLAAQRFSDPRTELASTLGL